MNQHLDKMALKLVKVAILIVSAIDLANGENCNSSRNSRVLEAAFGQVISSKLDNQTINMLDEIREAFEEILDRKLQEQIEYFEEKFEYLKGKFREQNESYELLEKELSEQKYASEEQLETILKEVVHLSVQSEWTRILNSHIWLSSERANFDNASEICDGMDARLYEPQSLLHNNLVFSLIEARGRDHKYHFIGIHDKHEEGT